MSIWQARSAVSSKTDDTIYRNTYGQISHSEPDSISLTVNQAINEFTSTVLEALDWASCMAAIDAEEASVF